MIYKLTDQYGIAFPPESQQILNGVDGEYKRNGFSVVMIGVELSSRIITHCIFGPIGGLLVASIFNKRRNAQQQ